MASISATNHIGHKKVHNYMISATDHIGHIHISHRSKQVMPYVSITFLFALQLKFQSQFCENLCAFFTLLTIN